MVNNHGGYGQYFSMSVQHRINLKLCQGVSFSIKLPLCVTKPMDFDNIRTRNWLVPGEKALVLIEASPSLSSLDAFSFYCTVTDPKRTAHTEKQPDCVLPVSVALRDPLPTIAPFRMADNRMIFPVKIQVPLLDSKHFVISAFCLRNAAPADLLTVFALQPFYVTWHRYLTPQSLVVRLLIKCNLPPEWKTCIPITSTSLKLNESVRGQSDFGLSIAIIGSGIETTELSDGDVFSVAFSLKPLSDEGAMRLGNLSLIFRMGWSADGKEYSSLFLLQVGEEPADFVISAPMIECELLRSSVMPIRVTNMNGKSRKVKLCFGSGKVESLMNSCELDFKEGEQTKSVEFEFIPLCAGEHQLKIWGEDGDKKIVPLLPICLSVHKTLLVE
jgi:hypothetical protein